MQKKIIKIIKILVNYTFIKPIYMLKCFRLTDKVNRENRKMYSRKFQALLRHQDEIIESTEESEQEENGQIR